MTRDDTHGASSEHQKKAAQEQALAEAAARRAGVRAGPRPREKGGQDGPEPTRYGDWEKAGIVSDF
ncbi:MAG: DUF1674 domain-containing protein [Alphaproteobacteria bacterium]|nr:DUF1674 domain-containing protein [Alphaproteobacteria bacterium]